MAILVGLPRAPSFMTQQKSKNFTCKEQIKYYKIAY